MIKVILLKDGRKQFHVDLGNIPADKAMEFVKQVKGSLNE